jgi:hypothetical protein
MFPPKCTFLYELVKAMLYQIYKTDVGWLKFELRTQAILEPLEKEVIFLISLKIMVCISLNLEKLMMNILSIFSQYIIVLKLMPYPPYLASSEFLPLVPISELIIYLNFSTTLVSCQWQVDAIYDSYSESDFQWVN